MLIISSGNLAQGKPAKQSSTYLDYDASRVVDGSSKSCAHTQKDVGAWLEVDLGAESKLQKVLITNRAAYCWDCRKYLSDYVENDYC